ncbi:protein SLX4IP isoform X2 [Pogoniulus pusillus]|uniref:protein SLX4IP isoform X2 n=1 Tax=Pogoniulus pusillus TaxID=488313 RepID=UPI0030B92B81
MASNKFVIKCGNFAVLVDVHILPQGSSKDTSWFSDHEKEELCMLLEEVVASRIKHYLETPKQRGQRKSMEHASSGPLFLTELRVFPDRFIVCVSKMESNPSAWTCENGVLEEELSSGTSEYFTESAENKKLKISLNDQIKQDILKEIVKRTKLRKTSTSKPQISTDYKKVCLGSVDSQMGNRKNDCQTALSVPSEVKCRTTGLLKDCINTDEINSELRALELGNYVNQRQPADTSSQQKHHSLEWLRSSLLSENPPCSSESALLDPKPSQKATKTQALQSCASEKNLEHFQQVSSEETPLSPSKTEMSKSNDGGLSPILEEKTSLNSRLFSKQDVTKTVSNEEPSSLSKTLSHPLSVRNGVVQRSRSDPGTAVVELPVMPSSCLELQPKSSEKLVQKRKKEVQNCLRKLKLRRLKKL